jgi:hypothetical protein
MSKKQRNERGEKESVVKKQVLGNVTALSFLVVLAVVSVNAQQSSENRIPVNIPFDVAVGETKLPAGNYTLRHIPLASSYDRLVIQSADNRGDTYTEMTRSNRARETQKKSRLVFNRYGDQYFLAQVWIAGSETGRDLFQSRSERRLAKEIARSKTKPQEVIVTARKQ